MKLRRVLIIGLLLFGLYARSAGVAQKVYTLDEVRGLLRASGVTSQSFIESVYTGEPIINSTLQKYQTAEMERPVGDALSAFANNPEHPPLYYLLMRFSLQLFQQASASRWLAVGFSLLLLPAVYWLCQELFATAAVDSAAVGWSTLMLVAVSPFQVLLAQEARQYSLWAVLTVVSSAFLLRSLQAKEDAKSNPLSWLGYGVTAALGMYAHLFFTWVLVTHGLYVVLTEKFRLTQKLRRYLMVSMGISFAFSPWVWIVLTRMNTLGKTTKWASTYDSSLLARVGVWLHNIGIGFIDFDLPVKFINPFSYLILGLLIYGIYLLCRYTPKRVWLFVVLLMAVSALGQMIPDLLQGGRRSLLSRYSLTVYLGMELAVGYAIARAFAPQSNRELERKSGFRKSQSWLAGWSADWVAQGQKIAAIALIVGGLVSSGMVTQSLTWARGTSRVTAQASPIINQSQSIWILSDVDHTYTLSLSHQLAPEKHFVLVNREQSSDYAAALAQVLAQVPKKGDFFVYAPSEAMVDFLQASNSVRLLPRTRELRLAQLYLAQRSR